MQQALSYGTLNYCANVIQKCFQYGDQFRPSRDPDLSKWAINNNFVVNYLKKK